MIEKMIPFVFKNLLSRPFSKDDIDNYEELSTNDMLSRIFDELSEENAHQLFEGSVTHIHESSHRGVFYITKITCNFLHLAVQLQRSDLVTQLINEYNVNPRQKLKFRNVKEEESYLSSSREKEIDEESYSITTLELAEKTGNAEIVAILNGAMNNVVEKKTKTTATSILAQHEPSINNDTGYMADIEPEKAPSTKPIHYKKRLILGEGNFSYSRALAKKQKEKEFEGFCEALTVTEYASEKDLARTYSLEETKTSFNNFKANVKALLAEGANCIVGVDATKIHQHFKNDRFKRIHFNFPYFHDDKLNPGQNKAKTRELVGRFFKSAKKIQKPGDRIHMALVTGFRDPVWYEDATYGVGEFCEQHDYVYIKKRRFIENDQKRYPGYFHVKTASTATVSTAANGREFIFEKRIPQKNYQTSYESKKTSRDVYKNVLRAMETDSDSSSYVEHSDEEQTLEGLSIHK